MHFHNKITFLFPLLNLKFTYKEWWHLVWREKVAFVVLRKSTSENVSQERSFVMSQAVRLPVNTRKEEKKISLGSKQATLPNFAS